MSVFGTPTVVVFWFAVAVVMSIGLPLYFGLRFDWNPASVDLDLDEPAEGAEVE